MRRDWTRVRPASSRKVVGVGLPKTGTTTLGCCLQTFGYKHRTFDMELALQVKRSNLRSALLEATKFESFADWPWFLIFRELDHSFPKSKFILTVRKDTETYVKSLRGHHEREGIRRSNFVKPYWWDDVFEVDPANWDYEKSAARYERHNQSVLEYFGDRNGRDLLVVCWENGDGWSKLAQFLNYRCPNKPFPHIR
ncbi:MAG: sulfotransferase [Pyrinomonadaceae bacterium]